MALWGGDASLFLVANARRRFQSVHFRHVHVHEDYVEGCLFEDQGFLALPAMVTCDRVQASTADFLI